MALETATYLSQLVATNPTATDPVAQGANHLRLLKAVLQAQFPNFTAAALNSTNAAIDAAVGWLTQVGQLSLIGEPRMWLSNTLPAAGNFIWLNGQAISRTTYPVLYTLWGTTYGAGNGSTTFNVPNFQEVVPIGQSAMGGGTDPGLLATGALGPTILGAATNTLTQAQLPNCSFTLSGVALSGASVSGSVSIGAGQGSHSHSISGGPYGGTGGAYFNAQTVTEVVVNPSAISIVAATLPAMSGSFSGTVGSNATLSGTAASGGSGTAVTNVQPSIVVNWITLAG